MTNGRRILRCAVLDGRHLGLVEAIGDRAQRLTTDALALDAPDDPQRNAAEVVTALLPQAVVSLP